VIAIYPLLLAWAAVLIRRRKQEPRPGWGGFTVWTAAGAVFTFSLLTGLSIGLLLLPLVVAALYLAARSAPDFHASIGFVAGIGVVLLLMVSIHSFSAGWLIPGVGLGTVALASFCVAQQMNQRRLQSAKSRACSS
jgi:hypothetical protein